MKNIGWTLWCIPIIQHIFHIFTTTIQIMSETQFWSKTGRQRDSELATPTKSSILLQHMQCLDILNAKFWLYSLGAQKSCVSPRMGEIYQETYTAGTIYKHRSHYYNGFSTSINLVEIQHMAFINCKYPHNCTQILIFLGVGGFCPNLASFGPNLSL